MLSQVKVSAPGKLMLFGEHAVIFDKPCIVTAVSQRLQLKATQLNERVFQLDAPDVKVKNYQKPLQDIGKGEIPQGARFVEIALANFLKKYALKTGIRLETISEFKPVFGFGSSSASAVCTIKALSELFETKLSNREIFDLAYQTVLDIQGVGSGFDLAAAIYGETLHFTSGGKVIRPLQIKSLSLIVGYTGVKADTATLIKMVSKKLEDNPKKINTIFESIERIVLQSEEALQKADFERLGKLMNLNQTELQKLGVSSKELDNLIKAALNSGAYGAKLSGAGGGDCMIAFAPDNEKQAVESAIKKAGGKILEFAVNAEGVKIEE
jgi:mevalonate kinase